MKALKDIVSILLDPLLKINLGLMAIGAVWLGVERQWQVISLGVLMIFFSPYIIPTLMIPAGIFSHFISIYRAAGRKQREQVMFALSLAYVLLFLTLWCTAIFKYVTLSVRPEFLGAALLWSNAAAITPLLMWAARDRQNIFIMTLVEVAQLAFLALFLAVVLAGPLSFWAVFAILGGILTVVTVAQVVYEEKHMKNQG